METWRPVVGHPDYEVSDRARVRRATPGQGTRVGRILAQRLDRRGYLLVSIPRPGRTCGQPGYSAPVFVHRLVASAFVPGADARLDVNHKNFDKTDNRPENLEWCTHAHNMRHSREGGRHPTQDKRGTRNGHARLTEDDVRAIRALSAEGLSGPKIGARFGITTTQVNTILRRRQWAHVE